MTGFSIKAGLGTVVIAIAGALLATVLTIPVPWLLGPLLACASATALGLPLKQPRTVEPILRVVIGVSLGPAVAGSLANSGDRVAIAIGAAVVMTGLLVFLGTAWFQRQLSMSKRVAFLAALPGGLSFLLSLASGVKDSRPKIALIHTVRVVSLVVLVSMLARVLGVTTESQALTSALEFDRDANLPLLVILVVISYFVASTSRIPGGHVIFSMVLAALSTWLIDDTLDMPNLVQSIAMLGFGVILGCEIGSGPRELYARIGLASLIYTLGAFAVAAVMAVGLGWVLTDPFIVMFLALAPGGIAEVSLVALALGLDAGFVALVHACRFILIMFIGPIGLKYFSRQ